MTSPLSIRRSTHRHALRAALAVTGRARRPLLLCCVLMGGISACSAQDDASQDSWLLDEDASSGLVSVSDMSAAADMGAAADMSVAADMGSHDLHASPDMPGVDASPEQDMMTDMPADLDSPDMEPVEDCVDSEGVTQWQCCERTQLTGQGCELCAESTDDRPMACLSCYHAAEQWGECCERLTSSQDIEPFSGAASMLGCSPWGPPAPPSRGGLTLRELGMV
jgi:hypothetical protein